MRKNPLIYAVLAAGALAAAIAVSNGCDPAYAQSPAPPAAATPAATPNTSTPAPAKK